MRAVVKASAASSCVLRATRVGQVWLSASEMRTKVSRAGCARASSVVGAATRFACCALCE